MRASISLFALILLPGLSGCLETRSEFTDLDERTRSYDGTAAQLTDDTRDPALAEYLRQLKDEEQQLTHTLNLLREDQRINEEQAGRLTDTHENLRNLRVRKMKAILDVYDEHLVDFVELNRWQLLPEAMEKLAGVDWSGYCDKGESLIIYGYGDPIGGEQPTQQISAGRARSVAQWIGRNSRCTERNLVARGLGVDVKADEIRNAGLPPEQQEQLYRRSRYARILMPKAQ